MIRDIDIIKAFKEGMSISELSKKYNYSRQGIYNILQRNNINYKKRTFRGSFSVYKDKLSAFYWFLIHNEL